MADIYIGNVKGPQGETGATGAQGPQGDAATIEVGTVSTTAYGNTAQVINTGTSSEAVFDFVIPQGRPGEETTQMSALTLDTVTAQSAQYPVPATGESGSVVFGKIIKFFNDIKSAIVNKINYSDCVYNLTSTSNTLPLAASQGKALNDALVSVSQDLTVINKFSAHNTCNIVQSVGSVKVYMDATVGSADIAAWTTLAYWRTPIKINSVTGGCVALILDVSNSTVYLTSAAFASDGYSFSIGRALTAGRRYMIGFTTVS